MTKYSFKIGLMKGLKFFAIFALPVIVTGFIENFPNWANLTIGGILVMIVNFIKVKAQEKDNLPK